MRTHVKIVALLNLFHSVVGLLATVGILVGGPSPPSSPSTLSASWWGPC